MSSEIEIGTRIEKENFDAAFYAQAAVCCAEHQATIKDKGEYYEVVALPPPQITVADYDAAMESHLRSEREARGYTLREPSDYAGSSVPRWAQDAADWIAHRDAVMLYALDVINTYETTGQAPTLEEFRAALPVITWTYTEEA